MTLSWNRLWAQKAGMIEVSGWLLSPQMCTYLEQSSNPQAMHRNLTSVGLKKPSTLEELTLASWLMHRKYHIHTSSRRRLCDEGKYCKKINTNAAVRAKENIRNTGVIDAMTTSEDAQYIEIQATSLNC